MKILQKGNSNLKDTGTKQRCPKCDALFIYQKFESRTVKKFMGFTYTYVTCPCCGKEIENYNGCAYDY